MKNKKHVANILFTVFLIVGLAFCTFGVAGVFGLIPGKLEVVNGATVVFGNSEIGNFVDTNDANEQSVTYFACISATKITDIMAYIQGHGSGNAMAAIYETGNGEATTLAAQSSSVSIEGSFSWVDFPLSTSFTPTVGSTYGLAILGNVGIDIFLSSGAGVRAGGPGHGSFSAGFSDPFGSFWFIDEAGGMCIFAASSSPSPTPSPTPNPSKTLYTCTVTCVPANEGTTQFDEPPVGVAPNGGVTLYSGDPLGVLAVPNEGFQFDYFWVTVGNSSQRFGSNPFEWFMQSDINVEAHFKPLPMDVEPTPPPFGISLTIFQYEFITGFGFAIATVSGLALYMVNFKR